ncbi:MAG: DUF1552 domain-containing protein [Myxococcota bacterium]
MTRPLHRRDLLRYGTAATFLFPVLRSRWALAATELPRYVQVYIPNGCRPSQFYPDRGRDDGDFDLSGTILEPLNPLRSKTTLFKNVFTDGNIHGMVPRIFTNGTNQNGRSDGPSLDWMVADQLASRGLGTPFRALHIGVDTPYPASGRQVTPVRNASGQPQPLETDPQRVFDRLFSDLTGSVDARCSDEARRGRAAERSVLDAHRSEISSARAQLGLDPAELRVLDEYESGVRELEMRLAPEPNCEQDGGAPPEIEALGAAVRGAPKAEHGRLMADLIAWAFRLDLTRVASLNFFSEGGDTDGGKRRNIDIASWFRYRDGDYHPQGETVDTFHHHLSHFGDDSREGRWHVAVNRWAIGAVAHLAAHLEAVSIGAGSLLDASTILYMSSGGDGDRHQGSHSPAVLIGGAHGTIPMGVYRDPGSRVYHGSVLRSVADSFELPGNDFGSNPDRRPIQRLW